MKKLIIANWKMLPETPGQAEEILSRTNDALLQLDETTFDMVICPPPVYRELVARLLGEGNLPEVAHMGAQDMEPDLAAAGVRYVIIGHSDRRWKAGDSDEVTNTKLKDALRDGLVPVVCLGERTREEGWQDGLIAQIGSTFAGMTPGQVSQCIIAYEPVWAISTNPGAKPDTPASAVQSMSLIREALADHFDVSAPTFLYGGSVTPANASEFLSRAEVSGVLVGGASVRPDDFCRILTIAAHL